MQSNAHAAQDRRVTCQEAAQVRIVQQVTRRLSGQEYPRG